MEETTPAAEQSPSPDGVLPSSSQSSEQSPDRSMRYMPGLDVLRGLAITVVFLYHGLNVGRSVFATSPFALVRDIPALSEYGFYGVHLFFILSGFLITGILLDTRNDADYFRNFYIRRVLRIVPVYVLVLVCLRWTGSIDTRYLVVCLLYFANMTGLFHSTPEYGPLWSLSVEEQFYLCWPLVIRKLSRRAVAGVSIAIVLLTPALRFALLHGPAALRDVTYKTWVVGDFFAAGALLALAVRALQLRPRLLRSAIVLTAAGALALAVMLCLQEPLTAHVPNALLALRVEPWLLLLTGLTLLAYLFPAIATASVATRALVFLSNISYGAYLIHQRIIYAVEGRWPLGKLPSHPIIEYLLRLAAEAGLVIALAWLSRNTLEKFFLSLKPRHHHPFPVDRIA